MSCKHLNFVCNVAVNRMVGTGRFNADVRIVCDDCKTPFRFIGLPYGLDLNGAAVSVDGEEGRFAVAPRGEVLTAIDPEGVDGFSIRRTK